MSQRTGRSSVQSPGHLCRGPWLMPSGVQVFINQSCPQGGLFPWGTKAGGLPYSSKRGFSSSCQEAWAWGGLQLHKPPLPLTYHWPPDKPESHKGYTVQWQRGDPRNQLGRERGCQVRAWGSITLSQELCRGKKPFNNLGWNGYQSTGEGKWVQACQ